MGWKITKDVPVNELKINLLYSFFLLAPDISYERILDTDISVGAAISASLDTDRNPYKFIFTPYFRWFFGGSSESLEKAGSGFFIEANGSVYSQEVASYSYIGNNDVASSKSVTGAGLGLALGWKYLSRNNWVGEIYAGAGRNFINNNYNAEAYPRMGISIGKRF